MYGKIGCLIVGGLIGGWGSYFLDSGPLDGWKWWALVIPLLIAWCELYFKVFEGE